MMMNNQHNNQLQIIQKQEQQRQQQTKQLPTRTLTRRICFIVLLDE